MVLARFPFLRQSFDLVLIPSCFTLIFDKCLFSYFQFSSIWLIYGLFTHRLNNGLIFQWRHQGGGGKRGRCPPPPQQKLFKRKSPKKFFVGVMEYNGYFCYFKIVIINYPLLVIYYRIPVTLY